MKRGISLTNTVISIVLIFLFLTAAGCFGDNNVKNVEKVDGSTQIVTKVEATPEGNVTSYELHYIYDGKKYVTWFSPNFRPALDWLRANSKPSELIMCWWDNGHMIRGYAKREPILHTPAYSILDTVVEGAWDTEALDMYADETVTMDVAYALLADSPKITRSVMKRYNTRWIFVARADMQKIPGMVKIAGENMENYLDDLGDPKSTVKHKMVFKMGDGWPVKYFRRAYEDEHVFIYELIE